MLPAEVLRDLHAEAAIMVRRAANRGRWGTPACRPPAAARALSSPLPALLAICLACPLASCHKRAALAAHTLSPLPGAHAAPARRAVHGDLRGTALPGHG